MIPYSDGVPVQRFPLVTVALIAANFAVYLFYELPDHNAAISHASFYPCSVQNACSTAEPWGVGWITAIFLHAAGGSTDVVVGHFRPGSAGQRPPRVSMAMPIRASGLW